MARRSPAFDAAKAELLLTYLQAGAYGHIAAEAAGIPTATLRAWLRRGQRRGAVEPYRSFARRYDQIQAQARLHAELSVFKTDPKTWLKCGPGKETADRLGWSREAAPCRAASADGSGDILDHPVFANLVEVILEALKPFPEARLAVAAAVQSLADDTKPAPKSSPEDDSAPHSEEGHER